MKITPKTLTEVNFESVRLQTPVVLEKAIQVLRDKKLMVGFAESCTGGLLSSLMSSQAGVSDVFWGSVVSYSNDCKNFFLKVDESIFKTVGAVSAECALQMSEGLVQAMGLSCLSDSEVNLNKSRWVSVSITGIAGPTGGTELKPVGTVFMAVSGLNLATQVFHHEFKGETQSLISRKLIQEAACLYALQHLVQFIEAELN